MGAFSKAAEFTYWGSPSADAMRTWHSDRIRGRFADPGTHQFKVADAATGKIVGFAKWDPPVGFRGLGDGFLLYDEEGRSRRLRDGEADERPKKKKKLLKAPEGADEGIYEEFFGGIVSMGEKWNSSEKLVLSSICMDASYRGRGIAAALIEGVLAKADAEGVTAYLEALPLAVPLYRRLGFVEVDQLEYDLARVGMEGKAVLTIMVREPKLVATVAA
ncbi:hypothetical protein F4804DRAFT_148332 [Jackrogersella minutella]|nr:hypothetical protein F4804DRAFT_148332 [Jackrogersella minutella]